MIEILPEDFQPHWKGSAELSEDEYHSDRTAISSTGLRLALRSPKTFYRNVIMGLDKRETPAMRLGSIAHMALLEPERFRRTYVTQPDFGDMRSSIVRAKVDAWKETLPKSARVMTQGERDKLMHMIDSLIHHDVAMNLIKEAVFEVSGFFRDPATGIKCRIRPDILRMDLTALPDLKTARDASSRFFAREVWERGYHVQMAFYCYGVERIMGKRPELPCFIVVENQPPYDVAVYSCDIAMMERGMAAVRKGLNRVAECLKEKHWPGLQTEAETLSLPSYTDWLVD